MTTTDLTAAAQPAGASPPVQPGRRVERVSHAIGFRVVATAFVIGMAFSTIPTPLWVLYRQADGFSTLWAGRLRRLRRVRRRAPAQAQRGGSSCALTGEVIPCSLLRPSALEQMLDRVA